MSWEYHFEFWQRLTAPAPPAEESTPAPSVLDRAEALQQEAKRLHWRFVKVRNRAERCYERR
jgi:hypothetical protein